MNQIKTRPHPDRSYNRNINGGKRQNKGIQKYGKYRLLTDRLWAEIEARQQYCDRVKNQLPHK